MGKDMTKYTIELRTDYDWNRKNAYTIDEFFYYS